MNWTTSTDHKVHTGIGSESWSWIFLNIHKAAVSPFFIDQCSKSLQFLQQDYERALYYLEACVTIPAMVVSHIMLESYKKYLLVSPHSSSFDIHLLLGGKCDPENENQLKWIIELVSDLLDRFRWPRKGSSHFAEVHEPGGGQVHPASVQPLPRVGQRLLHQQHVRAAGTTYLLVNI